MTNSPTREQIIEAVARALEPFAWEWMDRTLDDPNHQYGYSWAYRSGARTKEEMRAWCFKPDNNLFEGGRGNQLNNSLTRAEAILAAIASLAAIVPREVTEEQLATAGSAFNRIILQYNYAVMVEAGDLSKEKADPLNGKENK